MLIQFSVGNFLSFKEKVNFSMLASNIKEHKDSNVFLVNDKIRLLKSAGIYGANASGKTNLIKAMSFAKRFLLNSAKDTQANERINISNFKLSSETENKPSFFEFIFIWNNFEYRYGFELDQNQVYKEWLFRIDLAGKVMRESELFSRDNKDVKVGTSFREGNKSKKQFRNNALFLSHVAKDGGDISAEILKWFSTFNVISGLQDIHEKFTIDKMQDVDFKKNILEFLKNIDSDIEDLVINVKKKDDLLKDNAVPEQIKKIILEAANNSGNKDFEMINITSQHKKFDENGNFLGMENFDFESSESEGTKKAFGISGPILDTLLKGKTLIVDEMDARLHPLLTKYIISLFNSSDNKNAQLIFATHDTNLLDKRFFRRDQIWFTEKNKFKSSDLYSLLDYKEKPRNDASYEKDYVMGKYGAIPFINFNKSYK